MANLATAPIGVDFEAWPPLLEYTSVSSTRNVTSRPVANSGFPAGLSDHYVLLGTTSILDDGPQRQAQRHERDPRQGHGRQRHGLCSHEHRRQGPDAGRLITSTIGPYDYWAIEYGYKPIDGDEQKELNKIAARSPEPDLAYGTDDDMSNDDRSSMPTTWAATRCATA